MAFEIDHAVAAVIGMRRDRSATVARPPLVDAPQPGRLLHGVRERLRLGVPTAGRRAGTLRGYTGPATGHDTKR